MSCKLSLPSEPILSLWDTRLKGAVYYGKYFDEVKGVISVFNQNKAKYIENARNLFHN